MSRNTGGRTRWEPATNFQPQLKAITQHWIDTVIAIDPPEGPWEIMDGATGTGPLNLNSIALQDLQVGVKVETKDEQWTICDLESNKIHAWRNNINAAVIVWDVKNKGIFDIK